MTGELITNVYIINGNCCRNWTLENIKHKMRLQHLLIEWAGQRVGHKRPVCHCVDVLDQVMEEVTVGTGQVENTGQDS